MVNKQIKLIVNIIIMLVAFYIGIVWLKHTTKFTLTKIITERHFIHNAHTHFTYQSLLSFPISFLVSSSSIIVGGASVDGP